MANAWITHIKKTMRTMKSKGSYKKGLGLKQVIKEAKKSWHKGKRGGDLPLDDESDKNTPPPPPPETGGKRRRGRKTVRRGRK
jgi:hypothetical protein